MNSSEGGQFIYYIFYFLLFISLVVPSYIFLIYSIIHPQRTIHLGKKMVVKNEDLEPTEFALDMYRWTCVFLVVLLTVFMILLIIN